MKIAPSFRLGNFFLSGLTGINFFILLFLFFGPVSQADETLGKLELTHFLIEPTAAVKEVGSGNSGFSLGATKATLSWQQDASLVGRLTFGPQSLIGRPAWAGISSQQWGLVEGFAEAQLAYGFFRLGLLPIGFGSDGWRDEGQLLFPRTLLFQNRWVALRDFGASYQISHNGFYTRLVVHNGESAEDADNRTLQTAMWGWRGGAGLHAGLSGSAGRYVGADLQEKRLRIGNLFFAMDLYGVGFCAEGSLGETKTDASAQQFSSWHVDLQHSLTPKMGVLVRYDSLDPDIFKAGDWQREWTAGLSFKNETETSKVFVYGIKRFEEPVERANDEVRLVWRLNSSYSTNQGSWGK